uniref:Transposase (Putative), gypsy type n=1 Tax=Tanacetum cinerariifolium TaxID=118510 RepID=A0A6L2MCC4_TANCI|nr:hypothetical protein [Tanacetum cinerariifolium]
MDLFNLNRASNPTKVKIGIRPRAAHEVSFLTVTARRVIEMEEPAAATESSGTPSTIERSPLYFANENPSQQSTGGDGTKDQGQDTVVPEVPTPKNVTTTGVAPETGLVEEIAAMGPRVTKKHRKKGNDEVDANAPPKVLRKDHADSRPTQSTAGGKSLASIGFEIRSTFPVPTLQETPADVSDLDPLSFAKSSSKGAVVAGDPESENTSFTSMVGSPESIYQSKWGVINGYRLDTPEACQDLMDHLVPPWFEQEAKLLNKSVAQVARRDQRIQARENEIKNLEALLEVEAGMKKAAEDKNAELVNELENLRAQFTDLQVSNDRLSQQVSTLQAQVTEEEKLKAAFEEFKKYEDDQVEKRCTEINARLDALSIDFDEELYPHMLTTIADVIMASLHLESDSGEDAPQWIRELRLSSSQLKIHVYPEVRDLKNPGLLRKRYCWRTPLRPTSDGVSVSVPTVAPQGLALLLADAATQTETSEDGASPRLLRSKSLPAMYNLDWS